MRAEGGGEDSALLPLNLTLVSLRGVQAFNRILAKAGLNSLLGTACARDQAAQYDLSIDSPGQADPFSCACSKYLRAGIVFILPL